MHAYFPLKTFIDALPCALILLLTALCTNLAHHSFLLGQWGHWAQQCVRHLLTTEEEETILSVFEGGGHELLKAALKDLLLFGPTADKMPGSLLPREE